MSDDHLGYERMLYMTDLITWDAGDNHHWERPANPPCPDCVCCSAELCKQAVTKDSACHFEGGSADYDLSNCPCWREANARRLQEDHGETMGPGYVDPQGLARTSLTPDATMRPTLP